MLLLPLVLTQVVAEWVEISQQHYRKPTRMHSFNNPFTSTEKTNVENTTQTWKHNNRSIDYNWNKSVVKQPNVASVGRVQFSDSALTNLEEEHQYLGKNGFDLQPNFKQSTEYSAKQKGIIERVPNRGDVKRVQLTDNPVKSPAMNIKRENDEILNDRYEEFPLDEEYETYKFHGTNKNMETKYNNQRIYFTSNKRNPETISHFPKIEDKASHVKINIDDGRLPEPQYKNYTTVKNTLSSPPTVITEMDEFTHVNEQSDFFKVTQKKSSFTIETTNRDQDSATKNNYSTQKQAIKQQHENNYLKDTKDERNDAIKQPTNKVSPTSSSYSKIINNDNERKRKNNNNNEMPEQETTPKNNNRHENKDNNIENINKILKDNKPDSKANNMENLLKLLKFVADTISQNSRKGFGGKLRYLHELKDSILANIGERIESTWPDDVTAPRRETRSTGTSPRGHHVHFPSSESALMTISFLTFAVFLIKLVLQLIHTYKNKAMMVAPVMVASAGRASRTKH